MSAAHIESNQMLQLDVINEHLLRFNFFQCETSVDNMSESYLTTTMDASLLSLLRETLSEETLKENAISATSIQLSGLMI